MRRLVGIFLALCFTATATPARADGDSHGSHTWISNAGAVGVDQGAAGPGATTVGLGGGGPAVPMTWVWLVGTDPNGGQCTNFMQVPTAAIPAAAITAPTGTWLTPPVVPFPPCPAAVSPAALAYSYWAEAKDQLPSPRPHTSPDVAVTGKLVYLEIGGGRSWSRTFPGLFGNADITITASVDRYTIDWGDGTAPTETTSSGGPWPNGDVTHVYADTGNGTHLIVVTAQWTGRSNVTGVLGTATTTGALRLPAEQVQAVVS